MAEEATLKIVLTEEGQAGQPTPPSPSQGTVQIARAEAEPPPEQPAPPNPPLTIPPTRDIYAVSDDQRAMLRKISEETAATMAAKEKAMANEPDEPPLPKSIGKSAVEELEPELRKLFEEQFGKPLEKFTSVVEEEQKAVDRAIDRILEIKAFKEKVAAGLEERGKTPEDRLREVVAGAPSDEEKRRVGRADRFAKQYQLPPEVGKAPPPPKVTKAPELPTPEQPKGMGDQLFDIGFLASVSGYPRVGGAIGGAGKAISMFGAAPAVTAAPAAGGALAGLGSAAAAAAPIAAIVMAAKALKDIADESVTKSVRGLSQDAAKVGALDTSIVMDKFELTVDQASKPLGLLGVAFSESVKGVRQFHNAVLQTADRLAAYSPQIAGAKGQAEAREVRGDIGRANLLGKDLASVVESNSRIEQASKDALAQLLKPFLEVYAALLKKIADATEIFSFNSDQAMSFEMLFPTMVPHLSGIDTGPRRVPNERLPARVFNLRRGRPGQVEQLDR